MNFITKRNLGMKLLIVIFLMIFLFNNIFVNYSYGVDIGGVLFKPLSGLIGILLTTANATLSIVLGGIDDVWNIIMDHTPGDPAAGKPGWTDLILSPEHIFAGDYPLLDANIFNKNTASTSVGALSLDAYYGAGASLSGAIKTGVSGVYYILRNTCIVALLSVLIYTGIRIILSSNSPEKQGHWKMFLIDWMKAMALVIFIHVLMIAIFYVTDLIKEAFAQTLSGETIAAQCAKNLLWDSWDFTTQIISLVLFGYVTYLNIVFIIAYFKRLAWTVMLIVIAPVVAVMYPFRGVIDGKRAFDGWLKEFVMNAILPVYHIIIYYTLAMIPLNIAKSAPGGLTGIGGTFEILYSLFSITMIRPAEKFFRGLLGVSGKVANKGSFESGKKTLDAIGDAIKKVEEIAVVAAAGVATGGASLAAGGVTAGAAGAGGAAGAAGAAGVEGAAGAAGTEGALGSLGGENVTGILADGVDDGFGMNELDSVDGDMNQIEDPLDSQNNEGNNTRRLGNGSNSNGESGDNSEDNSEDGTVVGLLTEIRDLLADGTLDENGEDNTIKLQDDDDASFDSDEGIKPEDVGDVKFGNKTRKQQISDFLKQKIGNSDAANGLKNVFGSAEGQEALMGLRNSLHEITDSMYLDGDASKDWGNDTFNKSLEERKDKRKEATKNNIINNKNNINMIIKNRNLMDKYRPQYTDSKGHVNEAKALAAAENEAKTILERNAAFANYGIKDVVLMDKLGQYQKDTGLSTQDTIKSFVNTMKQTERDMSSRNEKVQTTINGEVKVLNVADMKGIGGVKMDPQEKEAIKSAIFERATSAMKYQARTGDTDERRSVNLAGIEKRLDELGVKVSNTVNKQDFVIDLGNAVQKAVKETGGKPVTMSNAKNDENVKQLEQFINKEIQDMKKK